MHAYQTHTVESVRNLSDSVYVLRVSRENMQFSPGQFLTIGLPQDINMREYSIYSGVHDEYLEILVKDIPEGYLSPKLHKLNPGDSVRIEGPFGYFLLTPEHLAKRLHFIATGTGIAPFHCFVRSYTLTNYTLWHGVSYGHEQYEYEDYQRQNIVQCTTKDTRGNKHMRVTTYLQDYTMDAATEIFLCGNSAMIYEVYDILTTREQSPESIHAEVYF